MGSTEELRVLSFCAGYAGIERGITLAGVKTRNVAFVEIEAFPVANLVEKMEAGYLDACPIWTDLKTFPLPNFRGLVDILTGGFPCQPFSAAGARGGDEDPRHLFPYFKRALEELKPRYVFLENVDGIASSKLKSDGWNDPAGTPVLLHVLRELERVGYRATAGSYCAEEVGAPHLRRRWFILGHRADIVGERAEPSGNRRGESEKPFRVPSDATSELDDSKREGLQRHPRHGHREGDEASTRPVTPPSIPLHQWPARPGFDQFEFEPPRVLADSRPLRSEIEGMQTSGAIEQGRHCGGGGGGPGNPARLNPDWVELLMGVSIGWTALDSWEMP